MKRLLLLLFGVLCCVGCHDIFVDDNPADTPISNFNQLWQGIDEHYCYFKEKGIDWNALKEKYSAQVNNRMSDEKLFEVCAKMVGELKDGHVNIVAPFNISRFWDWYQDYPANFDYNIIERNYLGKDFVMTSGMYATVLEPEQRNIGYMYYSSFQSPVTDTGMQSLMLKFQYCNGVILDLRDNGGGSVSTMFKLASYFTREVIQVGYSRYKSGKGHDDFTDYYAEKVTPSPYTYFGSKVVVLTNRSSFSAANIFAGMMKNFPNVTIIGDQTGGGSASPMSVNLTNGWVVRISSLCFVDMNKNTLEFGVEPHIKVNNTQEDALQGKDTILEYAINFLQNR